MVPSLRRLQQYAIGISIISILYNGFEGGISIGFGAETASRSLIFFGIQSGIEVTSAVIVLWRFMKVAKPGEEQSAVLSDRELKFEKYSTFAIGALLLILSLGTEISSIVALALHQEPDSSISSLVISASALVLMVVIWLPKRYLARALRSSAMQGEAICSLSCIQITFVLFVGSLVFRLWKGGWWLDGATSIILGLLFGWEGVKMVRWASDPKFDGGCCGDGHDICREPADAELGEQYRDICECCAEKESCRNAEVCQCTPKEASDVDAAAHEPVPLDCCTLQDNSKCCTRELRRGTLPSTVIPKASDCCSSPQCTDQISPPKASDCCSSPQFTDQISPSKMSDCCSLRQHTDQISAPKASDCCSSPQ